jgi:TonB-linked SusC/RagA family outer membrane protein
MIASVKRFACFVFILLAILPISFVFAQSRQVVGKVISSENNKPVVGASITIKGSSLSTLTDNVGAFKIGVNEKATVLVVSSIGFQESAVSIVGKSSINIILLPDVKTQDEVVVIGYQSIRRRNLLASVSSVGAKDLKDIPINSAAEALNGRLAGVTATTAEGSPDAEVRVRVRGGMSITGDNTPLYILDGVQVENALAIISPQDIQSIDVLKDAAATAIYGARGANGVIVITTKSGRSGKLKVAYNGFTGVKNLLKSLDVLNPYDFVVYQSERTRGSSTDSTSFANNFGRTWDTLSNYKNVNPVNWQDETFGRTGFLQTHNLSLNGGGKKLSYNLGYTYNGDRAIVLNSNYKRHLLNFKTDYRISKKLKVGLSTRYINQGVLGAGVSDARGSSYNRLRNSVKYRPFLSVGQDIDDSDPIADPNVGNGLNLVNPIKLANAEFRQKKTETYNGSVNLTYDIVKNLSFRSTFGYDYTNLIDQQYSDSITPFAIIQGAAKAIAGLDTSNRRTITNSNVLSYTLNNYKGKHDIAIVVGEESYDLRTEARSSLFRNFPAFTPYNTAFKETNLGTPFTGFPKLNKTRYTNISYFGRVNYGYADKYLFTFNLRSDGASKFAPGKQWGFFPAGSFAWRVKNEKFLKDVDFISDLKLRAGFGQVGNNRISDYLFLTTYRNDGTYFYGINNNPILAYYSSGLVNQDLKWESTINRNFGIDISLLNGRVELNVDYYNNSSKDLLLNVPVASTYGYSTQLQNIGKTSNKGVEIQLNTAILKSQKGLNWNANFNISFNKNKIVGLGVNQDFFYPAASWGVSGQPADYIQKIGYPVGSMYGFVTNGFYDMNDFNYNDATKEYTLRQGVATNSSIIGPVQPGSIKFADLNGDGKVDINNDRKIIGNPTPKFTGGLNQQFSYQNWDLSMFLNFSVGNDIYNANKIEFTNGYTGNSNMLDIMANRWKTITPTGQTAQWVSGNQVYGIPFVALWSLNSQAKIWQPLRGAGAFYPHSWAIEDGSFLRLNNLTFGYTVPSQKLSRLKMEKLRFYFTANNLAVLTSYTGFDPEVSVRSNPLTPGLDYSAYPKSRSFIFGINASF